MTIKNFLVCLFCLVAIDVTGQDVSFFKEDITFKIEGDNFYVNGIYYLKCHRNSDTSIVLFYPFPTDSIYSRPDSLFIFNLTTSEEITGYQKMDGGVVFNFSPDSVTVILISYRQQFFSGEAKYILTTTQYWGKALELATYKLIINSKIQIKSFSYLPDNYSTYGETMVYYWKKKNFIPLKDMIFILN